MERLKVLLPGCDLEKLLHERARLAEQMSSDLADMTETATQLMERRFHTVKSLDHTDRRQPRAAQR